MLYSFEIQQLMALGVRVNTLNTNFTLINSQGLKNKAIFYSFINFHVAFLFLGIQCCDFSLNLPVFE